MGRKEEDARELRNKKKKGKDGEEEEPGRQRAGVRQGDPVPHPDLPVAADQVGVRAEQVSEQQHGDFFISFLHSFIIYFEKGEEMGEDNCARDLCADVAPVTVLNHQGGSGGVSGGCESGLIV